MRLALAEVRGRPHHATSVWLTGRSMDQQTQFDSKPPLGGFFYRV